MISTKKTELLPDSTQLQATCKAMAVLDAILCQDWVYRYHSYNSLWADGEEFFEMRNGEGDQLLMLFTKDGAVINGFFSEAEQDDKIKLTDQLPNCFHEFIFGEPVHSAGTTFCLWKTAGQDWKTGIIAANDDHSAELLSPFDGQPSTYMLWATDYFKGNYTASGIPLDTVTRIYNQETLTKEMVLSLVDTLEDWEQLIEDLEEISYPYHI
ncbi:hypothetical protein [Pedobacter sp. L105]|uniref:hypothetical protein n=1 Tax=Pedobacter sp. L105 TaxID=1641871 RepID=UPI00131A9071|nr:hypothetical protein [Pedobacter sp. L105]